jgi:CDGSH-type Zn-finger protein
MFPPTARETVSQNERERAPSKHDFRPQHGNDTFALEDLIDRTHLTSPSQYSVETYHSWSSSKMKESSLSKTNLHDSSVLSFSSSEDETDGGQPGGRRVAVRKSLADYSGEIIIGQAQAYEVGPHRRGSAARSSILSTSTNAATIEVMYAPDAPFPAYHTSKSSTYSGSRRSSHIRQPSVIHEDDDFRPNTAINLPLSPRAHSVVSARTSASAPQPYTDGSHKLMQVTAEEEALLEMMRKKRAAMHKQTTYKADRSVLEHDKQHRMPREGYQSPNRASASLSMESLTSNPVRIIEAKSRQRAATTAHSQMLLAPRGRSVSTTHENVATSRLRDSSASDTWSDRDYSTASRGRLPHYLPTPLECSPLDPFPPSSPTPAASVASPTTTDHPSPLPSPITPGLYTGEPDVAVIVASSDTSNEIDDFPMPDNSVMGAPTERTKVDASGDLSAHRRRRTASSDAEIHFPIPPTSVELPVPKLPKKASRHISELALPSVVNYSRSRQSSEHSIGSRTSAYSQTVSHFDKRGSRHLSPDPGRRPMADDRDSVSDDVLAAWNSLGGT